MLAPMPGASPRPSQAVQRAYAAIREQIVSGAFPAGHRLVEDDLAELTGVSRTPVREALNLLRAEGLIEGEARRGARVTGWTPQEIDEIYELRGLLEGHGCRLAARSIGPEELDELDVLCDEMEAVRARDAPGAVDEIAELNNALHGAIFRSTGNRRLMALLGSIVEVPLVHRAMARYADTHLDRSLADHREIIAALRVRDADLAEALMRAHIRSARAALALADDAERS
jgi:DNA-binding GntR family transcriptional regulator